ncbi:unnamed protein product [Prorocentrum cordatum]|uniref:Uncharacterized protein n=1 Tax=Prorocentrum cordatum TaxID=2364126 RepID=A0ABN9TCZ9_9DINO|nr:unnamed protein product [Polarella glacialis]
MIEWFLLVLPQAADGSPVYFHRLSTSCSCLRLPTDRYRCPSGQARRRAGAPARRSAGPAGQLGNAGAAATAPGRREAAAAASTPGAEEPGCRTEEACPVGTLTSCLKLLGQEDPGRVVMVRRVNCLGSEAAGALTLHFSRKSARCCPHTLEWRCGLAECLDMCPGSGASPSLSWKMPGASSAFCRQASSTWWFRGASPWSPLWARGLRRGPPRRAPALGLRQALLPAWARASSARASSFWERSGRGGAPRGASSSSLLGVASPRYPRPDRAGVSQRVVDPGARNGTVYS